jgi:photosystem II stability/assembly factor-like uncharacterized protein
VGDAGLVDVSYVTTDGGLTWQTTPTGLDPEKDDLNDLQAIAVNDAVLVGSHFDQTVAELRERVGTGTRVRARAPSRGLLLRWNGSTWQRTEYPEFRQFWTIHYVNANDVWASADTNGLIRSSDGGRTWTFVPDYYHQMAALTPTRPPFVPPMLVLTPASTPTVAPTP